MKDLLTLSITPEFVMEMHEDLCSKEDNYKQLTFEEAEQFIKAEYAFIKEAIEENIKDLLTFYKITNLHDKLVEGKNNA